MFFLNLNFNFSFKFVTCVFSSVASCTGWIRDITLCSISSGWGRYFVLPLSCRTKLEENWRRPPRRPRTTYVDEDYPAGPAIIEPLPQRSNWRGSESSTLENDVYVWCYALIVVHAKNEWMNEWMRRDFVRVVVQGDFVRFIRFISSVGVFCPLWRYINVESFDLLTFFHTVLAFRRSDFVREGLHPRGILFVFSPGCT